MLPLAEISNLRRDSDMNSFAFWKRSKTISVLWSCQCKSTPAIVFRFSVVSAPECHTSHSVSSRGKIFSDCCASVMVTLILGATDHVRGNESTLNVQQMWSSLLSIIAVQQISNTNVRHSTISFPLFNVGSEIWDLTCCSCYVNTRRWQTDETCPTSRPGASGKYNQQCWYLTVVKIYRPLLCFIKEFL